MSDEVKPAIPNNWLTGGKQKGLGVDLAQSWCSSSRSPLLICWGLALVELYHLSSRSDGQSEACLFKPVIIFISLVMQVIDRLKALQPLRLLPKLKGLTMIAFSANVVDFEQQQSWHAYYPRFLPAAVGETTFLEKLQWHSTLQWVDQERERYRVSSSQDLKLKKQQLSVALPAKEMTPLLAQAIVADTRAIVERAARLEATAQQRLPVATPLRHLAQGFKKQQILKFLN